MRLPLAVALLALAPALLAQLTVEQVAGSPADLTEAFVRGKLRPADAALTGEAAANPLDAARLPRAPRIRTEELWRGGGRALVAAEFSNDISAQDLYVFLDSTDAGWRIAAFRDFQLPGVFYNQLNRYRNMGENGLREDWEATYRKSAARGVSRAQHEAAHGTADQRVFSVFNLRLASGSDRDLARHFEVLKPRFEALRQNLEALPESPLPRGHDHDTVGDDLAYLLVKQAYRDGVGPLRLEVASIDGKDVGYLYCAEAACMPTPTPGGVIGLRELGGGWYVYRRA